MSVVVFSIVVIIIIIIIIGLFLYLKKASVGTTTTPTNTITAEELNEDDASLTAPNNPTYEVESNLIMREAEKEATLAPIGGPWTITYDIDSKSFVPLRTGSNGNIECMSTDGQSCLWVNTSTVDPSNLKPKNCDKEVFKKGICDPRLFGVKKPVSFKSDKGYYLTALDDVKVTQSKLNTNADNLSQLWYIKDDNTILSASTKKYLTTDPKIRSPTYLTDKPNSASLWKYDPNDRTIKSLTYPTQVIGTPSNSNAENTRLMTWEALQESGQLWKMIEM